MIRGHGGSSGRVLRVAIAIAAITTSACVVRSKQPTPLPYEGLVSPVDGDVIAVDSAGLTDVRRFTLRTFGQATVDFKLGPLENATEFSPSHLAEHMATSIPVRVYFRVENGERVAYRLEDAQAPPT